MIIGICGQAGSGKDTAADLLVEKHKFVKVAFADPLKRICKDVFDFSDEQLWGPSEMRNAPDFRYLRVPGYRDAYERAKMEGDMEGALSYAKEGFLTPRVALQQLGTEWGRWCYRDIWVDLALRTGKSILEDGQGYNARRGLNRMGWEEGQEPKGVVISDVRFKNEIALLKKSGAKVVRIVRQNTGLAGVVGQHVSETEQLDIPDTNFDHILENYSDLHMLGVNIHAMMDRFTGRIMPFDEEQQDIPPFLRKKK